MSIFITILIGLFIIAVYLLLSPITLGVRLQYNGQIAAFTKFQIYPFPAKTFALKNKQKRHKKSENLLSRLSSKQTKNNEFGFIKFVNSDWETVRQTLFEVVRFISHIIKFPDRYELSLSLSGGLNQPHQTGQLFGAVCAIKALLPEPISLAYKPDFVSDQLSGNLNAGATFRLIKLIKETIIFVYRLPKWRLWKLARTARKD